MHNHSYENEFNLHVNEMSFSYERMSTKTRFEKEAKGNSEILWYMSWPVVPACCFVRSRFVFSPPSKIS